MNSYIEKKLKKIEYLILKRNEINVELEKLLGYKAPEEEEEEDEEQEEAEDTDPDDEDQGKKSGRPAANRACTFDGCDRPHVAKGYCGGHYSQLNRGETLRPLTGKRNRRPHPIYDRSENTDDDIAGDVMMGNGVGRSFFCFDCKEEFQSTESALDAVCEHCNSTRVDLVNKSIS